MYDPPVRRPDDDCAQMSVQYEGTVAVIELNERDERAPAQGG